jgi:branched-chain amino acid transport system permease protein
MDRPIAIASARRDLLLVGTVTIGVAAMALFGGGYFVYLLNLIGIFSLVAIGLNILTGFSGQTSLGHAGFFAIGAYASGIFAHRFGLPFWLAIPLAGAVATLIGAAVALPARGIATQNRKPKTCAKIPQTKAPIAKNPA